MDIKARSKPMREILTRVVDRTRGAVEIIIFGDKVILDEGEIYASSPVLKGELRLIIPFANFRILNYRRGKLAAL
jgi:hypothetical protein